MSDWYDRQSRPISMGEASALLGKAEYNRVARTEVISASDPKVMHTVSTVWLGLDHNYGDGSPLIFETMVFGDSMLDDLCRRYGTEDEAKAGHAEIVAAVAISVPDEIVADV